jgi:nanoRNase/pAp phosphatase (c-di-AMP/oligoRNAs hydrolase)
MMRKLNDIKELQGFLESHRGIKTAITFHSMGDTDSISSAIAISENFYGEIVCPDRITRNSERILENLGYKGKISKTSIDAGTKLVILVDVNNFEGCGNLQQALENFGGEILIIDHHAVSEVRGESITTYDDETYTSTASIITELLAVAGKPPTKAQQKLLIMGIISDSAEFRNSDSRTFSQIGSLLASIGTNYQEILEEMTFRPSPSERERVIRDIVHSKKEVAGNLLLLYGDACSRANIAADTAIRIGADVSIFCFEGKEEISFSARLRPQLDTELGIHLGKIMKSMAPMIDGIGGGHPCAAGAYGKNYKNKEQFIKQFVTRIHETAKR